MNQMDIYKKMNRPGNKARHKARPGTRISRAGNIILNFMIALFTLLCILPFVLVTILSFTDEETLLRNGYSYFPAKLSLKAYEYVFKSSDQLISSLAVSVTVTVIGTFLGVLIMSMYAYALYRKDFRYRRFFAFLAFFTLLFNGGLVPTYIVCTQMLHLKNSIFALILPLGVDAFYIMVLRTFFQTALSESVIDSARIDGAGEFKILSAIVFPMSLPGIATIALFTTLAYWNDWFQALLYIQQSNLYPLQYLLVAIQNKMDFMMQNRAILSAHEVEIYKTMPAEGSRMALVFLSTLPITLAYPFFQRYFIQGLQVGAIKE